MNKLVRRLGLNCRVKWVPNEQAKDHATIENNLIIINDTDQEEAWNSLVHEILELKIRPLLSYYRGLVNVLIGFIEKTPTARKSSSLKRYQPTSC